MLDGWLAIIVTGMFGLALAGTIIGMWIRGASGPDVEEDRRLTVIESGGKRVELGRLSSMNHVRDEEAA